MPGDEGGGQRGEVEEVAARAARLGITVERVLQEYARIAFADWRHIVEDGDDGLRIRDLGQMSDSDLAAIHEITLAADGKNRVKLYDRKAALDAIARHLGMFPPPGRRRGDDGPAEATEDARDVLARLLARLAPGGAQG